MKIKGIDIKEGLYALCRAYDQAFFLDSCGMKSARDLSRYEWVAAFGQKRIEEVQQASTALRDFDQFLQAPGWVFGVLSYDLRHSIEKLPSHLPDLHPNPLIVMVEPEWVVTCDRQGTIEFFGISAQDLEEMFTHLTDDELTSVLPCDVQLPEFKSLTNREEYLRDVQSIQRQIALGNVYEMNYCMQLEASWPQDLDDLSFHLARVRANPVPFTAYVRNKHRRLLCSSPERFLLKEGDLLYSQPIKGTLPRGEHALADEKLAFELKNNPKYRAENVMIVDLVRNDLARIAKQGSVEVEELFGVYGFAYVFQMISTIRARIDEDFKWADLLRALFPMGSMTGAPKIAAMQFIEAYEKCSRQWYSGSVFYRNQLGDFDSNVIIRSIYLDTETQKCSYGVGGAITYDSSPEAEYQECVDKLKGILPQP